MLLVSGLAAGCALGEYARDRMFDLTDVVDVKGAANVGALGMGLKLEVTDSLGAGLGAGGTYSTAEFFGRRVAHGQSDFFHGGIVGVDGPPPLAKSGDWYVCGVGLAGLSGEYPLMERWRLGAEVWLPFIGGGVYLNLAEFFDFLLGFFAVDLADDDGTPIGTEVTPPENVLLLEEKTSVDRTSGEE